MLHDGEHSCSRAAADRWRLLFLRLVASRRAGRAECANAQATTAPECQRHTNHDHEGWQGPGVSCRRAAGGQIGVRLQFFIHQGAHPPSRLHQQFTAVDFLRRTLQFARAVCFALRRRAIAPITPKASIRYSNFQLTFKQSARILYLNSIGTSDQYSSGNDIFEQKPIKPCNL